MGGRRGYGGEGQSLMGGRGKSYVMEGRASYPVEGGWRGGALYLVEGRGLLIQGREGNQSVYGGEYGGRGDHCGGEGHIYRAYPTPQFNAQAFKLFSNTIA